jgi:prepilin-type N-terminal cleavage/methylation domain-containing protein
MPNYSCASPKHAARPQEGATIPGQAAAEQGFSLLEFMLSSLILLILSAAIFGLLSQTQRTGSYQTEVQGVIENTRFAMDVIVRVLQQAGNSASGSSGSGIDITSATQVRVRSDLTGSGSSWSPSEPDSGEPDGDTSDAGEDVTIRYNAAARTIELGATTSPQPIACNISAFSMQYYDNSGFITNIGGNIYKVRVSLTGTSSYPDPQTGKVFSMQISSYVTLLPRR